MSDFIGHIVLDKGSRIELHTVFSTYTTIETCAVGHSMVWPNPVFSVKQRHDPLAEFKAHARRGKEARARPHLCSDNEWSAQWGR